MAIERSKAPRRGSTAGAAHVAFASLVVGRVLDPVTRIEVAIVNRDGGFLARVGS
jgi:hypothetical protein